MKYIFAFLFGAVLLAGGFFLGLHAPACPVFQKVFPSVVDDGGCCCKGGCCCGDCALIAQRAASVHRATTLLNRVAAKAGNCSSKCAATGPKGGKCTPEDNCSPCLSTGQEVNNNFPGGHPTGFFLI